MKFFSLLAAAVFSVTLSAETIKYDLKQEFANVKTAAFEGDVVTFKGPIMVSVGKNIKFDPAAKYTLSVEIKKLNDSKTRRILCGFICFDKNGRRFNYMNVGCIPGTDTVLAEPIKSGDKTITVKDAANWKNGRTIVFNTKPDGSDLPNYNISPNIVSAEKKGDTWTVTLKSPMRKAYPAGTAVRTHSHGGYIYSSNSTPAADWKVSKGTIAGINEFKTATKNGKFWYGTAFIRPVFLLNWDFSEKNTATQIRNATLTITK